MGKFLVGTLQLSLAAALLVVSASAQNSTPKPSASSQAPENKSQASSPQTGANNPDLPTEKAKISYAIGMNVGRGLHRESIDVDPNLILKGLQDALSGGKTLLTDQEAQATMVQLQQQVREREVMKRQQEGEENKKQGDAFLAENKTKPGVVTLPSGLQYKVLKEGTGPKPTAGDSVVCNYRGTLLDGKEFDSSYKRGEPATFPVSGVIPGWTEALQLMPVGSKWQLWLPPDLAYRERGAPPDIGPNQTLVFEVELMSIAKKDQQSQPNQPGKQQ